MKAMIASGRGLRDQRGIGLIETTLALFLLSLVSLATISLLVGIADSFVWLQRGGELAHETLATSKRLRQGAWMSGYGLADSDAVRISGSAPATSLGLRYRIDNASVFNRYDCSRSRRAGIRTNTWQTREADYPGARAELMCQGRSLDIQSLQVLGFAARTLGSDTGVTGAPTNWRRGHANTRAVEIDLLLQYPAAHPAEPDYSHPFSWEGVGEDDKAPMVWTRLRLPLAIDLPANALP